MDKLVTSSNDTPLKPSPVKSNPQNRKSIEIEELYKELSTLDQKIEQLGDGQKLREAQMQLLHKYNDVKDATQLIIGKLADVKGVTFKSIHKEYDLPMND